MEQLVWRCFIFFSCAWPTGNSGNWDVVPFMIRWAFITGSSNQLPKNEKNKKHMFDVLYCDTKKCLGGHNSTFLNLLFIFFNFLYSLGIAILKMYWGSQISNIFFHLFFVSIFFYLFSCFFVLYIFL